MIIVLGIGNPEREYSETRHNVGKEIINFLFQKLKNNYSLSPWKRKKFCQISEGKIKNQKIILAKNLTFMNNCGKCASFLLSFFKSSPSHLIVIHDDYDIPFGKIKISQKRGSAGHKGIESIFNEIGTKNFIRIRIGIRNRNFKEKKLNEFVLKNFSQNEKVSLDSIKERVLKFFLILEKKGLEKAITRKY